MWSLPLQLLAFVEASVDLGLKNDSEREDQRGDLMVEKEKTWSHPGEDGAVTLLKIS